MAKKIKLNILGKRFKDKDYDFISFSGIDLYGKKCGYRFTKDVKLPKKEGAYLMLVSPEDINVSFEKKNNKYYLNYWVKDATFEQVEDDE